MKLFQVLIGSKEFGFAVDRANTQECTLKPELYERINEGLGEQVSSEDVRQ